MAKKKKNFEEKLQYLESILEKMNSNSLMLQELLTTHEEAQQILKELQSELENAKQKFFIVDDKGELQEQDADI